MTYVDNQWVINKKSEEKIEHANCPVTFCMSKIDGKWKPTIIYLIRECANRCGILERGVAGITKQMLTKQLREMEADGILERKIYPEIPPRVEYFFTLCGESLFPVIDAVSIWGLEKMDKSC